MKLILPNYTSVIIEGSEHFTGRFCYCFNKPNFNEPNFNEPNFNKHNLIKRNFNKPNFNKSNFNKPNLNKHNFNLLEFFELRNKNNFCPAISKSNK